MSFSAWKHEAPLSRVACKFRMAANIRCSAHFQSHSGEWRSMPTPRFCARLFLLVIVSGGAKLNGL
jgi:hypothetical protein